MAIGITFAKMRLYSMLKRIDHKETTSVPNGFSHEYLILDRKYDKIQSTIICSAISHFLSCRAGNGRREFLCGRYIHLRRTVSSTKEKLLLLQSSGILIPLSPSVPPCIPFSFRLAFKFRPPGQKSLSRRKLRRIILVLQAYHLMPFLKRNAAAPCLLRLLLHLAVHPVQMGFQRIVEPGGTETRGGFRPAYPAPAGNVGIRLPPPRNPYAEFMNPLLSTEKGLL